jgi:hypothetical protein
LPPWLPYFLLAVLPALIVGLLVYATLGDSDGGGGGGDAASVVDGLFRSGGNEDITSYKGQVPPGFPSDFPTYPGSKVVVSFLVREGQAASFFVIYQTPDDVSEVIAYFQEHFDEEPWQVQGAVTSGDVNGLGFSRPDDADVEGSLTITKSELGDKTAIYVQYEDVSASGLGPAADKPFTLTAVQMPPGFPSDIPVYEGREKSTVTQSSWARGSGVTSFQVAFVTKNSDVDVIDYYRKEFEKRGWQVKDGTPLSARDFSLSLDFQDSVRQQVQGTIRADAHPEDGAYTLVQLEVNVSASRGRGN